MRQTDAVIIGAGQAGLGMSYCLRRLGVEHVVLERGQGGGGRGSGGWGSVRLFHPHRRRRCVWCALGPCDAPVVPAMARSLPVSIHQVTPTAYRNPDTLPVEGVL